MKVIDFEGAQCKRMASYLDSYINGELSVETSQEVQKHTERCETCASALADRVQVRALLKRAILSEPVPERLGMHIRREVLSKRSIDSIFGVWMIAAAAVVVLAAGVAVFFHSKSAPARRPLSMAAEVAPGDDAGQILKVGFNGHVSCAIDHEMANKHFTVAEMSEKLGSQYAELVGLVKTSMPQDYEVVVGHRCHYQGRELLHLILRRKEAVVSLIVTRKGAEAFAASGAVPVLRASGVPIYESSWRNLQVAGMETRDYLAFVVSNEPHTDNEQIASSLMPAVRDFLKQVEA